MKIKEYNKEIQEFKLEMDYLKKTLQMNKENLKKTKSEYEKRNEVLSKELDLVIRCQPVLSEFVNKSMFETLKYCKEFINKMLNLIFSEDEDKYDIDILIRDTQKSKEAKILYSKFDKKIKKQSPYYNISDSCGGGLREVISLLIRIYSILYFGKARILILDEPFSGVAKKYITKLNEFFEYLVNELGFHILFVTHIEEYLELTNSVIYQIENGEIKKI